MRRLVAAAIAVAAVLPGTAQADPVEVEVHGRVICAVLVANADGIPAPPKMCVPLPIEPCYILDCDP